VKIPEKLTKKQEELVEEAFAGEKWTGAKEVSGIMVKTSD
jgi:hypothetical protein